MASIDESGRSSGTLAQQTLENSLQKTFDRYAPGEGAINKSALAAMAIQKAEAISCFGSGFGSCSSPSMTVTRNFNNCTVNTATLSGDVTLRWIGSSVTTCAYGGVSDTLVRSPNFNLTGRRGATLSVTKAGTYGQRLTLTAGYPINSSSVFSFSSDGINRKFTTTTGSILYDQTTSTSGTLTVTGNSRSNRVITSTGGASIKVVNNLTSVVCNYTPTNVTWNTTACNCPTQGSWSGTCSDGKSATLTLTGCGSATYTEGTDSVSLSFDRCASN